MSFWFSSSDKCLITIHIIVIALIVLTVIYTGVIIIIADSVVENYQNYHQNILFYNISLKAQNILCLQYIFLLFFFWDTRLYYAFF